MTVNCETVARAVLGLPAKRIGNELFWPCPWHDDKHPSFQVNTKKNCFFCGPCGISGTAWQLAARFAGLSPDDKPAVMAWLGERCLLNGARGNGSRRSASEPRRVAEFYYSANLRKVRFEPGPDGKAKSFVWEHRRGDAWERCHGCKHELPLYANRIFRASDQLDIVLGFEGEAKADLAGELGFSAFSFTSLTAAQCAALAVPDVVLWPDKDDPGLKQCQAAATLMHESKQPRLIRVITPPPELPAKGDIVDAVYTLHWGKTEIKELIRNAPEWMPKGVPSAGNANRVNPWSLAAGMETFLGAEEEPVAFLHEPTISKGAITQVFSPRGLGKSLWVSAVAVLLASKGHRGLLIDRDNPRREVRARLRGFGATRELKGLKVISREHAPPLTNRQAWADFPYAEYHFVVLDSFDSAAEGVGEQDSTKPSLALAPLLDIARREEGPAVLVLGNTVRTGAHSRGSGVIEDRADIVFEVRDATNFHPTGQKPWIEELPAADAGSWAGRSTRRKRLSKYRLAFIPTKFRIGEEPEPFIIEINLESDPWSISDVTDEVGCEGQVERERQTQARAAAVEAAAQSLGAEILRRETSGEPVMLKTEAEKFLAARGIKRKVARDVIDSPTFQTVELTGKGHPKGVRLADKKDYDGGNSQSRESASNAGFNNSDFCRPHPEHTAEIPTHKIHYPRGSQSIPISAEPALSTPSDGTETASPARLGDPDTDPDGEVRL